MNWVDIVIIIIILLFILSGVRKGLLISIIELGGMVISLGVALALYVPAGTYLEGLGLSPVYAGAVAFLTLGAVTVTVYSMLTWVLCRFIPELVMDSWLNKLLGSLPGLARGLVFVLMLIAIFISLPVPGVSSDAIDEAALGSRFLNSASLLTAMGSEIFGDPLKDAIGFFTIQTEEEDYIELNYTVTEPEIAPDLEKEMLALVNEERRNRGLPELVMDNTLRDVARDHSVDMFQRGYFAHVDAEGVTPFDRMRAGGVTYIYAGENLAIAPTVSMAHQGLMDSPGHKENILNPSFRRVGIGAAKGGRRGVMFTQKFTD